MKLSFGDSSMISRAFATRAAIVSRFSRAAAERLMVASLNAITWPSRSICGAESSPSGISCHTTSSGGRLYPSSE